MKSDRLKYVIFGVVGALTLALDQWTKALAREALRPLSPYSPVVVVDGFFKLRYSENTGVAFGLLQSPTIGMRIILTVVATAAVLLVLHYLRRTDAGQRRLQTALALVGGGALGNLVDRILFGRVSDFIVWHYREREWPAFNIADAALVVGVLLMSVDFLPSRRDRAVGAEKPAPATEKGSRGR